MFPPKRLNRRTESQSIAMLEKSPPTTVQFSSHTHVLKNPGGGGGGGCDPPPPGLGGLEGSDWKGEKFGGSEEKKRALHADPVDRRII